MKDDRRIHVLHLVRWYPYPDDPMFGLFIRRHILATRNHTRATVIFIRPVKGLRQIQRDDSVHDGLREIRIAYPEKKLRIFNALTFMRIAWRTAVEVVRRDTVDLVHVHVLTRLGIIAWGLKKRFGIPYVITEHWSRYIDSRFRGGLRVGWTRRVVSDSGALINVSGFLRDVMRYRGLRARRTEVVPNVVDTEVFDIYPTADYFVHVSCFQREAKNVFGLIRAMALAKSRNVYFRLVMVGVGETRDACIALAAELGVDDRVEFPGLLEGEVLARCVGGAVAMVLFSDFENAPVVVSEALVAGVPVISTRVGEVPALIDASNGILIHPGDGEALISAMGKVIRGEVVYDRAAIRREACAIFGVGPVSEAHRRIYSEILQKPSAD